MQFPKVISVRAISKYILDIRFNDGTQGTYEVSDLAGKGVFKMWDINDNFFKVYIDKLSGAISWPGELDIDTINAYCSIKGISTDTYFNKELKYATN